MHVKRTKPNERGEYRQIKKICNFRKSILSPVYVRNLDVRNLLFIEKIENL